MIGIIDLKICNLKYIHSAVNNLGHYYEIINKEKNKNLKKFSHLIIPGVGSFSNISKEFFSNKDFEMSFNSFVQSGKPILGICLGMHFLSKSGFENGHNNGLGLIDAEVQLMPNNKNINFNLPHIGWNEVEIKKKTYNF